MVDGTRVDRLISIDVAERYEALQDEVDLLKNEIKQTLVDLRGFMMEDRTIFPRGTEAGQALALPRIPAIVPLPEAPSRISVTNGHSPSFPEVNNGGGLVNHVADPLDVIMLGEIISWLGTVKRRGMSLHQITPYVEAYEAVGFLSPIVVKIVLRSMADLDQMVEFSSDHVLSPEEYSECVREFHEIVTTKPAPVEPPAPSPMEGIAEPDNLEAEEPGDPEAMEGQSGGQTGQPVSSEDEPGEKEGDNSG